MTVAQIVEALLRERRDLTEDLRDAVDELHRPRASATRCAYGHQDEAKRITASLLDDNFLKKQARMIGNEFDLRHAVESWLDESCKFTEE